MTFPVFPPSESSGMSMIQLGRNGVQRKLLVRLLSLSLILFRRRWLHPSMNTSNAFFDIYLCPRRLVFADRISHLTVKMEKEPFTHGAMRHCFRMKKLATPPESSRYHRFYKYGWSRASNYVAKAYVDEASGKVDTSDSAREAVKNDIKLQYESMRWANVFNEKNPPKQIIFIRAWAMEMPDRKGHPWFAIERFISGNDSYGTGFIKHNTNSGFVDQDLQRNTPQVFSAHSFYASNGRRLVADIQGVGDLYTDPQVRTK